MEFLKLAEILLRRKTLFLMMFTVFFATVIIVTHTIPPTWEVKTKVIVKTSEILTSLLDSIGLKNPRASTENYETEIVLSTLKPILEEIIEKLDLKKRFGGAIEPEKLIKSSFLDLLWPRPFIEVVQYEDSDILEFTATSSDSDEAVKMADMLSQLYIKSTRERNNAEYRNAVKYIEKNIKDIHINYITSLTEISDYMVKTEILDVDKKIDELMEQLNSLTNSYDDTVRSIQTIDKEIEKSNEKLQEIDVFRKESKGFGLNDQIKELRREVNDSLINLSVKSIDIKKDHPDYKSIEKKLVAAKEILEKESIKIFDNERFGIDPKYDSLARRLMDNFIQREVMLVKKRLFKEYIDLYKTDLLKLPDVSMKHSEMNIDRTIQKTLYQEMLDYLVKINLARTVDLSNIRIMEKASVPSKPVFPVKPVNYVLGLFLGIFWALAVVFFMEYVDNSIKTPSDLEKIGLFNLLGIIVENKDHRDKSAGNQKRRGFFNFLENTCEKLLKKVKKDTGDRAYLRKVRTYRKFKERIKQRLEVVMKKILGQFELVSGGRYALQESEAYRQIKNKINIELKDKKNKVFTVTSCSSDEGTSRIASNISMAYGTEKRKVVIVDLNLRKPQIHNIFDISNEPGMVDILEKRLSLEEAIVSAGRKNVDVLPCGTKTEDPGRVIETHLSALEEIIEELKKRYEIVIIDAPPILKVVDPMIIAGLSDGILLVIRANKVSLTMVNQVVSMSADFGHKILGAVLNRSRHLIAGNNHYYY
jgi:capsular exopolysaccharide synthesis family protein